MAGPKASAAVAGKGTMIAAEAKEVQSLGDTKGVFKVPRPPLARKRRKKVLAEDAYVDTMEHIIRRDFFPDLHAAASDADSIGGLRTPGTPGSLRGDTPASQLGEGGEFEDETPLSRRRDVDPIDMLNPRGIVPGTPQSQTGSVRSIIRAKRAKDMKLDKFCATHTSEDNASFQDILAKDRLKLRKKYWWLQEKDAQGARMLTMGDSSSTGMIKYWNYTNKNSLMYVPNGVQASPSSSNGSNIDAKNTRFSASSLQIGEPSEGVGPTLLRQQGGTPMIRGYKLMRTPSPMPGNSGDASPIITWGDVASTPMHLRDEDSLDSKREDKDIDVRTRESTFQVPEMSFRDRIGLRLGDSARIRREKRRRERTPVRGRMRTPKGQRQVGLSPAAVRLLSKKKISKTTDSQLRASYASPSPMSTRHSRRGTPFGGTPHRKNPL